jgi:tol-pal system protein YbgF
MRYGSSAYVPSALFWLGNAQYANKAYKESMANFQKLLSLAPNHSRAAEAMLAISNVQIELKDTKAARKTLEDLIAAYPRAETAGTARERLSRLR